METTELRVIFRQLLQNEMAQICLFMEAFIRKALYLLDCRNKFTPSRALLCEYSFNIPSICHLWPAGHRVRVQSLQRAAVMKVYLLIMDALAATRPSLGAAGIDRRS